jgi:hypothetical protein
MRGCFEKSSASVRSITETGQLERRMRNIGFYQTRTTDAIQAAKWKEEVYAKNIVFSVP